MPFRNIRFRPAGVVLACGAVAMLDGADAQSLAIAAPLIARDLSLSSAAIGLVFSIAALGSALGYLCGGALADRSGARPAVLGSMVIVGLFQMATALAGGGVGLALIRFAVALGLGGAVPGLIELAGQALQGPARDRVLGLVWACFPLGVLAGSLLNGWILRHSDWRVMVVAGGAAALAVAGLGAIALRPDACVPPAAPQDRKAPLPVLRGQVLLAGLVFFLANGAVATVMNWTPSLLVRAGYGAQIGARASACSAAGALASMAFTGFLVARSRVLPIVAGFAVAGLALVSSALFLQVLPVLLLMTAVLGAALGLAGTAATFLPAALLPPAFRARGLGLGMAVGRVGQMVFPGLAGLLLQAGLSPRGALLALALVPGAGVLVALGLLRRPSAPAIAIIAKADWH